MSADRWLAEHRDGVDRGEALAWFRALPAVTSDQMLGRWQGSGLPTGSPLDGLLEAYGWYGKEFIDAETAHPLLFRTRSGPRPVDPALIPVSVLRDRPGVAHSRAARLAFTAVRPLLTTTKPKARLRAVQHHGIVTAADRAGRHQALLPARRGGQRRRQQNASIFMVKPSVVTVPSPRGPGVALGGRR